MPRVYKKTCDECGVFYIGKNAPRFCSISCAIQFNSRHKKLGPKKGFEPWNKGTKGLSKPNNGSFQKGAFSREKHWNWQGGKSFSRKGSSGYITVRIEGKKKYQHRVIMEKALGRPLKRTEHVHHRNRKRDDNRLSNLVVVDSYKHLSYHAKWQWANKPPR